MNDALHPGKNFARGFVNFLPGPSPLGRCPGKPFGFALSEHLHGSRPDRNARESSRAPRHSAGSGQKPDPSRRPAGLPEPSEPSGAVSQNVTLLPPYTSL